MKWKDGETTEEPTKRVWALILWKHGTTSIPLVAQWEPSRRFWCHPFNDFTVRHADVEWCPLPRHERFDDRTHLMEIEKGKPIELYWHSSAGVARSHSRNISTVTVSRAACVNTA